MLAGMPGAHHATKIAAATPGLMTLICAAIGTVLAVALARWAKRPARAFTVTTVALTFVSLIDPVFAGATAPATKITLACAHLLAAAIVIPALARRLSKGSLSVEHRGEQGGGLAQCRHRIVIADAGAPHLERRAVCREGRR
jgi:hypothetical protein